MQKRHYIVLIIMVFLMVVIAFIAVKAGAHQRNYQCDNSYCQPTPTPEDQCTDAHNDSDDCLTPTPSLIESPTPTATPEATITPVVNETTSVAGSSGSTGGSGGNSTPTCNFSIKPALLQGFKRLSPTSIEFSWWVSEDNPDKQSFLYGYSEDNLQYSQLNFAGNISSITIHDLNPNVTVWGMVRSYKGDCVSDSNKLDP